MITYYQCEICGSKSENKEKIIKCESKGVPIPLVKEGDIIYFKDCEEIPILYGYKPNQLIEKEKIIDLKMEMQYFIGKLYKYKVLKIKIIGHDISYVLMPAEYEDFAGFSYIDLSILYESYTYPTIEGNELMQKILDLYNKGE